MLGTKPTTVETPQRPAHGPNAIDGTVDAEWALKLATVMVYEARTLDWSAAVGLLRARIETVRAEGTSDGLKQADAVFAEAFASRGAA
jgi:hypothetical protein